MPLPTRPLGHTPERAHFELPDFVRAVGFNGEAESVGVLRDFADHLLGAIGQHGGRQAVAGLIDQVAGKVLRFADDAAFLERAAQMGLVLLAGSDHGHVLNALVLAVALVGIGIEIADEGSFGNGLDRLGGAAALKYVGAVRGRVSLP
jgi:hypothetical protein